MSDRYARLEVQSRATWRAWLAEHHADVPGIWLVTYKKAQGARYLPYEDQVLEALCFGWIDSVSRGVDDARSALLMTPRKAGSGWSGPNKRRVAQLEADGRLEPAGAAVIEAARADGSWTKLDAVEALEEPDDLKAALDATGEARRHWNAFPRGVKRGILEWIVQAKRPATREGRITETATMAARGERANQWTPRDER